MNENEKVLLVKLTSCESFISNVKIYDESENTIFLNFPMSIARNEANDIVFVPWMYGVETMTEDGVCQINPISVATFITPFDDLKNAYLEFKDKTFSNIIKPTPEETKVILN